MRKLLLLVLALTIFLSFTHSAFGQDPDGARGEKAQTIEVEYEKVNPSNGFDYGLKRFKEKLYLAILFYSKDRKIDYYNELVTKRLAELKYVVETKDMANFENATTRYFTTVGQFTDFLTNNGTTDQKSQSVKNLSSHIPVLDNLRDMFDGQEEAEWRFIQDDVNYVKTYIDQLQK